MKPDIQRSLLSLGGIDALDEVLLPEPVKPLPKLETPFDASNELDELTTLSLKKAREILELPIDDSDKIMRAQISTIQTILNTQVRVDEGRLKRRKIDALPKLLEIIAQEEGRLGRTALAMLGD